MLSALTEDLGSGPSTHNGWLTGTPVLRTDALFYNPLTTLNFTILPVKTGESGAGVKAC